MIPTIAVVSSNTGGANVTAPIVELARARGHRVIVLAGGKGLKVWKDRGIKIDVEGAPTLVTKPEGFNARDYLQGVNLVIAGQSFPYDWEVDVLKAAREMGIRSFSPNDFWGGSSRFPDVEPDLVGALDKVDIELSRDFSSARHIITGNPGAVHVSIPLSVSQQFARLRERFSRIYLYVMGGPESALSELKLVVDSMLVTPKDACVILRRNPKYSEPKTPEDRAFTEAWDAIRAPLGDRAVHIESDTGEPLAALADVTLGGFSTLLTVAIYAGKIAIVTDTPKTLLELKARVKITRYPHEQMGWAKGFHKPRDLTPISVLPPAEKLVNLRPYDPGVALEAALSLLQ